VGGGGQSLECVTHACNPNMGSINRRIAGQTSLAKMQDPIWKTNEAKKGWGMVQMIGHLPTSKVLSSNPSTAKTWRQTRKGRGCIERIPKILLKFKDRLPRVTGWKPSIQHVKISRVRNRSHYRQGRVQWAYFQICRSWRTSILCTSENEVIEKENMV
jgi:hypothetical protein